MDQQCSDENNNQSSQSQDIESETINTNQDDTEVTSTRDILSGIDSSPEKDISVAYERLTLGRPRTDWSGLCWDPELVQVGTAVNYCRFLLIEIEQRTLRYSTSRGRSIRYSTACCNLYTGCYFYRGRGVVRGR